MPRHQRTNGSDACRLVLAVDDVRSARLMLERLLDKHGIPCVVVGSAARALQVMQTREVALLLTDYRMPDIDGLDLVRSVRASHPATRVIVLTGYEGGMPLEELAELRVKVLLKPADSYPLFIAIDHELELYRIAAEERKRQESSSNGSNGHG